MTGFSPLGSSSYVELDMATHSDSALDEPIVAEVAAKHGKSPAQVLLRWGVQTGASVIPKSVKQVSATPSVLHRQCYTVSATPSVL